MSNYKKLFSNTLAMGLGQFSSKLLSFLLVPLYTAILSTEQYGTYDLVITTVTLLTPFFTLTISEAVMRFCMDKKCDPNHVLTVGLVFTLLGTTVLTSIYPLLCKVEALGSTYSLWLIIFFLVINLHTIFTQFLKGIDRVKFYSACGILSTFLALTMNILFLVVFKWSIMGYFLASTLSHLIIIIIIAFGIKLHKRLVNPFSIPRGTYRQMLIFSVPMVPNSVSWWISNSSCKYMLLYFASASIVGIFSVAYKIPSMLTMVTTIFISAFQISIFENFGNKESHKFFSNIYSAFSSLNIVVSAFLIAVSKVLATFLYQNEFFFAWKVSCIIIFAYVFNSLAALTGTVYSAAKKTRFLFVSTLVGAGMNVLINLVLIPLWGMHGAAIATLISYMMVWLLRLLNIRKQFQYQINVKIDLLSFVLIIAQIAVMYIDQWWSLPIALITFAVIFVINLRSILKSELIQSIVFKLFKKKLN